MKYRQLFLLFSICFFTAQISYADQFPVVVEAEVRAMLSAERGGVLSKLRANIGDRVKKGAVLAVVSHQELIFKKQQRDAQRRYRMIQVENLTKLNEKGLTTDEELAKAKMELTVNDKEISMINSEIRRSEIRAPFSGVVVARGQVMVGGVTRDVQHHEWVTPGQDVVELYDPRKLRIVADIPAEIAMEFKRGEARTLFFPDLKQDVRAKVKVISPQVDIRSNTIKVYWTVAKNARLMPGMKGVLKIGSD
ncbi:efflux RND transporter periplasmic adaptor subunit [Desulfococcaceae bacterium HSG8]|nr:efflux RND transporter periplasmic adaptor subunit [Desulfococcaceae bacterium HSG8]